MAELKITLSAQAQKANVDVIIKMLLRDMLFGKSVILSELQSRGKIKYNKGGTGDNIIWRPTYRRPTSTAQSANPFSITFERRSFWKEARLPWRARINGIAFTDFDQRVNKGQAKHFDLVQETVSLYTKSMMDDIRLDCYTDGNTNTDNLMGLRSWTGNTGACGDGVPVMVPNDTYANLSTVLGNYSGSWTPPSGLAWPIGIEGGNYGYCFWSPMGIDVNNSYFSGDTFYENWQEIFNFGSTFMEALHGERVRTWIICPEWFYDMRTSLKSIQTLEVTQNSNLTKLGFPSLTFLGQEISFEQGIPNNTGWGICWEHLEMWSLLGQLIASEKDRSIRTLEDLTALYSYIQLVTKTPGCQIYLEEVSSRGSKT